MEQFRREPGKLYRKQLEVKKLAVILSLLLISCASASAQWYVVSGMHRIDSKSPSAGDTGSTREENDDQAAAIGTEDRLDEKEETVNSPFTLVMPDALHVGLVLPFQIGTKANSNFLEMYSGALLAVRDFGSRGKKIEVSVLDKSEPGTPLSSEFLEDNHLVIGPVNAEDIQTALEICPADRFLVSPLDPKAAVLAESDRLIQAPSHWARQADEIIEWISHDTSWQDEIVLVRDTSDTDAEQAAYLVSRLVASGKKFRTVSNIQDFTPVQNGVSRFLIASNHDSFINTTVRTLGILASKYSNITLYGTSKVRNSSGIDPEHLYNLGLHYTTSYFIDYEDQKVKDFIYAYRALYKQEPGQFAFQGYDILHYFLNVLSRYGEEWYKKLPEYSERGLQSDFRFEDSDTVGNINTAVRRVLLGKDLSAVIQ